MSIEDTCKEDNELSCLSNLSPEIHVFQRIYNPLHLYCRLIEIGISKEDAKSLSMTYEEQIYSKLVGYLKRCKNGEEQT